MTIKAAGGEGEVSPRNTTLDVTYTGADHRGFVLFEHGQSQRASVLDGTMQEGVPLFAHGVMRRKSVDFYYFNSETIPPTAQTNDFFAITDEAGMPLVCLRFYWTIDGWNGVGNPTWVLFLEACAATSEDLTLTRVYDFGQGLNETTEFTFDLMAKIENSTLYYSVYLDGGQITSGSTGTSDDWSLPVRAVWGSANAHPGDLSHIYWREMILSQSSTVGVSLIILEAKSAGFYAEASGSYLDVTGPGVNLGSSIAFTQNDQKHSWIIGPLSGSTVSSTSVQGILVSTVLGPNPPLQTVDFRPFVRVNGTDYESTETFTNASSEVQHVPVLLTVNPATGVQFTAAELTAGIEFGLKAEVAPI